MDVVKLFMNYSKLYSWEYIALMQSELTDLGLLRIRSTETFLDLLNNNNVSYNKSTFFVLSKRFYELKGGNLESISRVAGKLLDAFELRMDLLLNYIEVALQSKEVETLIEYVR
jgi:hypothetical protein